MIWAHFEQFVLGFLDVCRRNTVVAAGRLESIFRGAQGQFVDGLSAQGVLMVHAMVNPMVRAFN